MEKIRYTCVADTVFSLLLYLLYTDDEDGKETFFCVGDSVGSEVAARLPHCFFYHHPRSKMELIKLRIKSIKYRKKIRKTQIFAQDHIHGAMLIGHSKYTLLEDALGFFNTKIKETNNPYWLIFFGKKNLFKRMYGKLMYASFFYDKIFGQNKQCINRIITTREATTSEFIDGRKYEVVDINSLWVNSSETKKNFILKVFNVSNEMLSIIEQSSVLFLTSPFMEVMNISETDFFEILKPYYQKYINDNICIKPHPKECKFPYEKYFPQATVLKTRAPMELLNLVGAKIRIVVSEGTSAIRCLPSNVEIEYADLSINDELYMKYGYLIGK